MKIVIIISQLHWQKTTYVKSEIDKDKFTIIIEL